MNINFHTIIITLLAILFASPELVEASPILSAPEVSGKVAESKSGKRRRRTFLTYHINSPVDVSVSKSAGGSYLGNNVYLNTTPAPVLKQTLKRRISTFFRVENDEYAAFSSFYFRPRMNALRQPWTNVVYWDVYRLSATKGNRKQKADYFDLSGGGNVTAAITRGAYIANITTSTPRLIQQRVSVAKSKKKRGNRNSSDSGASRRKYSLFASEADGYAYGPDAASVLVTKKKERKRKPRN